MAVQFDPKSMNGPMEEIIPSNEVTVDIYDALDELEPVVKELSKDISGIGQKAAERYLLRYEYGMATDDLANEFGVTAQTISNQVSTVRTKVLKYPRLARVIGTLRAHRADLSQPNIDNGHSWEGEATLHGEPVQYRAEFKAGTPGRSYSWCYSCESRYERDTEVHHLFEDYLIDAIHGVFLKRITRGFSFKSWKRPPIVDDYRYVSYALPNLDVPNNRNGTLLDAAEYYWAYDTKNYFDAIVSGEAQKGDLEGRAEHDDTPLKGTAYYARDDVLSYRMRNCNDCAETIRDYTETVHIRNNIERLLRMYPLDAPFDLPYETVTLLWNGQPSDDDRYDFPQIINKQQLYKLTHHAGGRHRGRDVRVNGNKHSLTMPVWPRD